MNKARRTLIDRECTAIRELVSQLRDHMEALESLRDEEQECYDNMPEGLQGSDQGQRIEGIANDLDSAISTLDSAISEVDNAVDEIEEAANQ